MGKARTSDPNEAVGASLEHPYDWVAVPEEHTFEGTYGFTLWKPDPTSPQHPESGSPAMRVALAPELRPEQIEAVVQDQLNAHPYLPMSRGEVSVGEGRLKGVTVGPKPGSTPSTEVYVPVAGERVYRINVYGEQLDEEDRELLSSLEFGPPSQRVDSLELPDANAPEELYAEGDPEIIEMERSARAAARSELAPEEARRASTVPQFEEFEIAEGCWTAESSFFFQTQHGPEANARWGPDSRGWTLIGRPNFWGQFTHGNLQAFGRCVRTNRTNDMYAIDFPLDIGDIVYSPFKRATVTWAGRHVDYINYGIFVVTQAFDSTGTTPYRYWNLSAHLSNLAPGINQGSIVTDESIIGFAGKTGDPSIPVGEPHLHSAFYRSPRIFEGRPFGGQGLKVIYHHFVGTAAGTDPGVYEYGWQSGPTTKSKGDWISN